MGKPINNQSCDSFACIVDDNFRCFVHIIKEDLLKLRANYDDYYVMAQTHNLMEKLFFYIQNRIVDVCEEKEGLGTADYKDRTQICFSHCIGNGMEHLEKVYNNVERSIDMLQKNLKEMDYRTNSPIGDKRNFVFLVLPQNYFENRMFFDYNIYRLKYYFE